MKNTLLKYWAWGRASWIISEKQSPNRLRIQSVNFLIWSFRGWSGGHSPDHPLTVERLCAVASVLGEVFHTGFIYGLFEKWNVDKGTLFFRETLS